VPTLQLSRWTQLNSACNWGLRGCGLLLRLFPPSPKSNNSVHVLTYRFSKTSAFRYFLTICRPERSSLC
jgi:hypothetical protein